MAQQGSLYAENGSWFVRYWEIVRQPDGSLKRKHPAHRLASVKDYPRKSGVIPLKNSFMEKLSKIGFTPEAGVSIVFTFVPISILKLESETAFVTSLKNVAAAVGVPGAFVGMIGVRSRGRH